MIFLCGAVAPAQRRGECLWLEVRNRDGRPAVAAVGVGRGAEVLDRLEEAVDAVLGVAEYQALEVELLAERDHAAFVEGPPDLVVLPPLVHADAAALAFGSAAFDLMGGDGEADIVGHV